jgi:hypothetical protein
MILFSCLCLRLCLRIMIPQKLWYSWHMLEVCCRSKYEATCMPCKKMSQPTTIDAGVSAFPCPNRVGCQSLTASREIESTAVIVSSLQALASTFERSCKSLYVRNHGNTVDRSSLAQGLAVPACPVICWLVSGTRP